MLAFSSVFVAALLGAGALATSGNTDPKAQVAALKTAATAVDRLTILSDDSDFIFDFNTATPVKGGDGDTVAANVGNFPALTGENIAMTIGHLGPCGMNTPHTHPRATEILYLLNGTIQTGMIQENGARFVFNNISEGQAALFPRGAIHFQQNNGCDPVVFVAALSNEDPGVQSTAQRYFGLPPAIVAASLGDLGVVEVAGIEAKIPDNIAFGTEECLQRCGIKRPDQPTNQRQPRVAANALPSGFSGPPPPAAPPATSSPAYPSSSQYSRRSYTEEPVVADDTPATRHITQIPGTIYMAPNNLNGVLVGLVGVMALGYIAIAVLFARRQNTSRSPLGADGDRSYQVMAEERYADNKVSL